VVLYGSSMSDSVVITLAFVGLLAVFGPPMWWYSHGRKLGEKREKKWGAILLGILLVASVGATPATAKGDWLFKGLTIARALAGAWLIAFGAKGSPAK
jgi:hypothetical protein